MAIPDCFIIMPITTPPALVDRYGDEHHFKHVLDCLFRPALERAKFRAIPPSAEGSDLIHAQIIKHLEQADIVLCDMTSLNANVFFELGIRTAVNKPVAIVKDSETSSVDTTDRSHFHTSACVGFPEVAGANDVVELAESRFIGR